MASLFWLWFCFLDVFANKRHVAPNLNLVNVSNLNKLLRSKVFVSEDRQLRAIHLILDFKPLSNKFQDVSHAIRVSDPRLARIDVSMPGFLAREDIVPVELPPCCSPREAAILREEIDLSRLSLEAEIDQFRLEEEGEEQEKPVIQVSDSEGKLDRSSIVRSPKFIVARLDNNS